MNKDYKMDIEIKESRVDYDPEIIQQFAQRLYRKAERIELLYSSIGGVIFAFVSSLSDSVRYDGWPILVAAGVGIFIGHSIGSSSGLRYRIEAQQALCFAQIEKNTRPQ